MRRVRQEPHHFRLGGGPDLAVAAIGACPDFCIGESRPSSEVVTA